MITVDILALEELSDHMVNMASDVDELLSQMQMTCTEIRDNPEMAAYPQYTPVLEALMGCTNTIAQINESVQSLKIILLGSVDEYKENEEGFAKQLDQMLSSLNALHLDFSAAAAAAAMLPIEMDEEIIGQNKLQQLVADSSSDMQLTNLAAVTQVIEEEYGVTNTKSVTQLAQDIAKEADAAAISGIRAEALKIEDDDEIALAAGFGNTVADNRTSLDHAVDQAQKIVIDSTSED